MIETALYLRLGKLGKRLNQEVSVIGNQSKLPQKMGVIFYYGLNISLLLLIGLIMGISFLPKHLRKT